MPHESGEVTDSREARVRVRFAGGALAECVVDTGFDGALMLPAPSSSVFNSRGSGG